MVAQLDRDYVRRRPGRALARLASWALFEGRPLTTRGQWINPWLQRIGHRIAESKRLAPVTDPVYIIGTGRSGTTVLGKVLSMHRDVGYLNEPKLMWNLACPYEDVIGSYSNADAQYALDADHASEAAALTLKRLYRAYLTVTRNTRVLDKYPELVFRTGFVRAMFPAARFLFLVRSGVDTVQSIEHWSRRHGANDTGDGTVDWWGRDRRKWKLLVAQLVPGDPDLGPVREQIAGFERHTDMAAVEWILSMRAGLRAAREDPDAVLQLRYEDFVAAPAIELARIMAFCSLPEDPAVTAYAHSILNEPAPKPVPEVDPVIREPFERTMAELGYA